MNWLFLFNLCDQMQQRLTSDLSPSTQDILSGYRPSLGKFNL
ncbi:hypothetical protein [Acinetobacter bereziniae]|nr:hypothetical protein [Acinetobacter bereziniae]